MPESKEVTLRIHVSPEGVFKVDAPVGSDADLAAALTLCERFLGAIRDFDRKVREFAPLSPHL